MRILLLILIVFLIQSCHINSDSDLGSVLDRSTDAHLISNIHIIDIENNRIIENQFVVITGDKITSITSNRPSEEFSTELNGTGKFLMPGLINMYTHVNEDNLILYLVNGQTTVKDAPSHLTALGLREKIKDGKLIGPRIFAVGLRATGMPAPFHSQQPSRTPKEAIEQVRESMRLGYDGMFIYGSCDSGTYSAIMEEAKKNNFHISGHYPLEVPIEETINKIQVSFDNLTGITRGGELRLDKEELIKGLLRSGQAITPTLTIHRLWSLSNKNDSIYDVIPKEYIPNKMKAGWLPIQNGSGSYPFEKVKMLVKEFYDRGVPLYIGSDGGYPKVVNGFAYHQELEIFEQMGIPIPDILRIATVESARFLGFDNLGLVKENYLADLLILNKNPLDSLHHLKDLSHVYIAGKSLSQKYLNEELENLKDRILNPANRFAKWQQLIQEWESDSLLHYSFRVNDVEVGEEIINFKIEDKRNFILESVNVMEGPDRRETYYYVRIADKKVDSMSLKSVTPEGNYIANISVDQTDAIITGFAPFHGEFEYTEPIYSGTLLLGPFSSRYFDLDIASNYVLAMLMKRSLDVDEADQLPVIQIELNSEEFGRNLIIDNSDYVIYRSSENKFKIIYPGFSGYRSITAPSFLLNVDINSNGIPVQIKGPGATTIQLNNRVVNDYIDSVLEIF